MKVKSTYGEGSEFKVEITQGCLEYEPLAKVKKTKNVLLYEPRQRYRFSIAQTLESLGCQCITCDSQLQLYKEIDKMQYDYILTAAFHLKKVQEIVQKYKLKVSIAAFADYGETITDHKVYTMLYPVHCLQLAILLNEQEEDYDIFRRDEKKHNFIAPTAHVLVVDDNEVNLQIAKGLMEPYQFKIDTAENGLKAVEMVKQTKYDLVFMDHMMPEMDGVDATVAIRQMKGEYYQKLPIIALTANALVRTKEMFIHEGMNDFLTKPIEIKKLVHALIKWLPLSKIEYSKDLETIKSEEKILTWNIAGVNTEKGVASVGGSKEKYLHILSSYYSDGEQKSSSLPEHILKNNISAFRIEIHALKSTSATIGAFQICSMAEKMELAALRNDIEFIKDNIDSFLADLKKVLEAIFLIISNEVVQVQPNNSKEIGNVTYMQGVLEELKDAVEFVNIKQMEQRLNDLEQFSWTDEITKELNIMQECIKVFDYDGVLECVVRLKGSHC